MRLPYARRLAVSSGTAAAKASLAGIALALRALARLLGRRVGAGEILFAQGQKPRLTPLPPPGAAGAGGAAGAAEATAAAATLDRSLPDFSISHSGPWVGCAAVGRGRVGFDVELGTDARIADWVLREAALKATGTGMRAARELRELELRDGRLYWRGEGWNVRRLALFPGTSACVLSSLALGAVAAQPVALAELFAP